jgi:hypothetical protein
MLTYSILVTAEPAEEPITTAEAKSQARIDIADDDTLVASFIVAARMEAESWLGRRLVTQTIDTYFDCWPHVAYYTGTPAGNPPAGRDRRSPLPISNTTTQTARSPRGTPPATIPI